MQKCQVVILMVVSVVLWPSIIENNSIGSMATMTPYDKCVANVSGGGYSFVSELNYCYHVGPVNTSGIKYNISRQYCEGLGGYLAATYTLDMLQWYKENYINTVIPAYALLVGFVQREPTSEPWSGWEFRLADGRIYTTPVNNWYWIPWHNSQPNNAANGFVVGFGTTGLLADNQEMTAWLVSPLCQYDPPFMYFKRFATSQKIINPVLYNLTNTYSILACQNECWRNPVCLSFSYSASLHTCYIHLTKAAVNYPQTLHNNTVYKTNHTYDPEWEVWEKSSRW